MEIPGLLRRRLLRVSRVPRDLDPLMRIDAKQEVDPREVGLKPADIDRVWDRAIRLYRTGVHPAVTLHLRHRGKVVMARSIGHARGNGPNDAPDAVQVIARPDTPMCLFSASKAVTALLMHMLAEDGLIDVMDPVAAYAPEFGRKGKQDITVHQLLSHRGGIPGLPREAPLDLLWDEEKTWELLCEAEPIITDGSKLAYHAVTGGFVLERVLRQVTGYDINAYLDRKIRKPMGMRYFSYGIRPEQQQELALNYATGPRQGPLLGVAIRRALGTDLESLEAISNDPRFLRAIIPSANLVATAGEVSAFFQMMLNSGSWRRRRICRPETIAAAVKEVGQRSFDRILLVAHHLLPFANLVRSIGNLVPSTAGVGPEPFESLRSST